MQLRADRQTLLTQMTDPLSMRLILSETAPRRQTGGHDVTAGQMTR
ncbi:Scr1 family TA system antitoxin-like transcriptional regulator [Streptomyces sp. NPDC013433]